MMIFVFLYLKSELKIHIYMYPPNIFGADYKKHYEKKVLEMKISFTFEFC